MPVCVHVVLVVCIYLDADMYLSFTHSVLVEHLSYLDTLVYNSELDTLVYDSELDTMV